MAGNDKVQGEGDYASARRFQKDEKQFVEEHTKGGKAIELFRPELGVPV